MAAVFIDFENYYDVEYTLRKMPIVMYVTDPRFETIGLSIAQRMEPPEWVTGHHVREALLDMVDFDKDTIIAHNAQYDCGILKWHYGFSPKRMYCTMMGARPYMLPYAKGTSLERLAEHYGLPPKGTEVHNMKGVHLADMTKEQLESYGAYANHDVDLCRQLYIIQQKELITRCKDYVIDPQLIDIENETLNQTLMKFIDPKLVLDTDLLEMRSKQLCDEQAQMLASCGVEDPSDLRSRFKFARLLRMQGVEPPKKISPRTGNETFAFAKTDQGMKDLIAKGGTVGMLCEAKLGSQSSLERTRINRLIETQNRLQCAPFPLLYYGAGTGRSSGNQKVNMQNLPRGSVLRQALQAPPGHVMIGGDLSQIEARLLAAMANQVDLVAAFRRDEDVYVNFAAKIYKCRPEDVTPDQRFLGKQGILGLGFQCGKRRFHEMLVNDLGGEAPSEKECGEIVDTYRETYRHIKQLWYTAQQVIALRMTNNKPMGAVFPASETGFTEDFILDTTEHAKVKLVIPGGRVLHYPGLTVDTSPPPVEDPSVPRAWRPIQYLYSGDNREPVYLFGGKFIENIIQALAQVIIRDAEVRVLWWMQKHGYPYHAVGQVHDELLYCVKDEDAPIISQALSKALVVPPQWAPDLPLACEVNIGRSYADLK